jgi:hypothetical protein
MYVCVENLNHSLCVTEVMQVVDLAQESLKQLKMDILHFVDASEVLTQPENVMAHIVLSKMINGKKIGAICMIIIGMLVTLPFNYIYGISGIEVDIVWVFVGIVMIIFGVYLLKK